MLIVVVAVFMAAAMLVAVMVMVAAMAMRLSLLKQRMLQRVLVLHRLQDLSPGELVPWRRNNRGIGVVLP